MKDSKGTVTTFGLARIREEGAPVHPEDMTWEHYPDEGCEKCRLRWERQLQAWKEWNKK